MLAVHPHQTPEALAALSGLLGPEQTLLSLVASWRTEAVAAPLPGVPVVRAVPNVGVAVRAGATVFSAGPHTDASRLRAVEQLFAPLGETLTVAEELLETVSAVSGAGPALVAHFARSLAGAGVAQGLDERTAAVLAAHAVRSTGALLAQDAVTVEAGIDSVASPGGMTEAALRVLDADEVPAAARRAVDAAVRLSMGRLARALPGNEAGGQGGLHTRTAQITCRHRELRVVRGRAGTGAHPTPAQRLRGGPDARYRSGTRLNRAPDFARVG